MTKLTVDKETIEQALEAHNWVLDYLSTKATHTEVLASIAGLRAALALAQPVAEPAKPDPDSGRIITSGDVINDLHDEIAQLRGTRKVLWNLLGECLPVIDALMQMPGDDDSDARLNGLAGRITGALNALAEDQVKGGES